MEINRRTFVFLLVAGILVRVLLIATSIGTNDIINWIVFARLVDDVGIGPAYARFAEVNHPPLALLLLLLIEKVRGLVGLEVGDLLRLTQAGFDVLAAGALVVIGRSIPVPSPYALALFYFLSPVSIFVSGFHGNTDPAMVALLLMSLALLIRQPASPLLAGVLFAASAGIKIVPLFLLPLVLLWRRDRWVFAAGFAAGAAAIFLPFLFTGGPIVLQRIFGYNAQPGNYGFSHLMYTLSRTLSDPAARALLERTAESWISIARYAVGGAIALYSIALAVRRERTDSILLAGCGLAILIALVLTPGIGMQYLVWPIAFLPFALTKVERWTIVGVFTVAQLTVYTIWSNGFPWWYADSTVRQTDVNLSWFGDGVWLAIAGVTLSAVVRSLRTFAPSAARSASPAAPR